MTRYRAAFAFAVASSACAACSAILGIEAPPEQDAGATSSDAMAADATTGDAGSDAQAAAPDSAAPEEAAIDGGALETATPEATVPPACAALDAGTADGGAYGPFGPAASDAGPTPWTFYGTSNVASKAGLFSGGAFDGRYAYFAPAVNGVVARLDTSVPALFKDVSAWSSFDVATLAADGGALGGFSGALFDGRFVYFVPHAVAGSAASVIARFDTAHGALNDPSAWTTFDAATIPVDGGAPARGFSGATSDGRFVYFVPSSNGAGPDGRVVRYQIPSAPADAGEAGAPDFGDPAAWATFDVTTTSPGAAGFVGGAFDGKAVYLVPFQNGGLGDNGYAGIAARFRADAGFGAPSSWSALDLTTINGEAFGFSGAAFDGRYLYFVPHQRPIALRLDTTSSQPTSPSAWSTYDVSRLASAGGGTGGFGGGAFDGRFVYYVPSTPGFSSVVRYDTLDPFGADCAWSTVDLSAAGTLASGYFGAVFDGEYLYLVPRTSGFVARFDARTPRAQPALPAFQGSFY